MFHKAVIIIVISVIFVFLILDSDQLLSVAPATCVSNVCSDGRGPCKTSADCGEALRPSEGLCQNGYCSNTVKTCKKNIDCISDNGQPVCVFHECSDNSGPCLTNDHCKDNNSDPSRPGSGKGESFRTAIRPNIPTEGLPSFGELVATIFTWSLNILGIVVFVMIFFAGFKWFTAAGNTAKVNEARGQITNAITGALILLSAYIILYTINPDLVGGKFELPGVGSESSGLEPGSGSNDKKQPPYTGSQPPSLLSDLKAERSKYPVSFTELCPNVGGLQPPTCPIGKMLNTVAWKNKDAGWVLLGKATGTRCPMPGGTPISCDFLVHQPTLLGFDVLIGSESQATPTWQGPNDMSRSISKGERTLVAPIQP